MHTIMSRPLYVQKKGTGKKKNSSEVSKKTKDKASQNENPLPVHVQWLSLRLSQAFFMVKAIFFLHNFI